MSEHTTRTAPAPDDAVLLEQAMKLQVLAREATELRQALLAVLVARHGPSRHGPRPARAKPAPP